MNSSTTARRFLFTIALLDILSCVSTIAQPISLVQKPIWSSFRQGGAHDIAVTNNYAFIAVHDAGLMVLDVSIPSAPRYISQTPSFGWAHRVKLSGDFAYVATLEQIEIVDISDPVHPTPVGSVNFGGSSKDVDVVGAIAYVADDSNGLRIYDVSLPELPILYGTATNVFATGVKVVGNYAYVAAKQDGLKIVDVRNPAQPVLVGASSVLPSSPFAVPYDVYVRSNYVFLSGGDLHVFNVTNPAAPVRIGGISGPDARGMDVAGDNVFLATQSRGLKIINISNPAAPFSVTTFDTFGFALNVFVKNDLAYIADDDVGLVILNVTAPATPTRVGEFITGGSTTEVQVVGTNAVLADIYVGVRVLNVSNPTNVTASGWVPVSGAIALQAVSNRIYAACQVSGIYIIDISNPSAPVRIGGTKTVDTALDVCVVSDFCYVADSFGGLQIYDISNPTAVTRLGGARYTNDEANATGIHVVGHHAYLSYAASGLQIFDVQNPANPVHVGEWKNGYSASAVFVEGNYAYLANSYSGLDIIDVSDRSHPELAANFPLTGAAFDVQIVNGRAYVACLFGGITVVDVSNPRKPRFVTRQISGHGFGVAVVGNYVYLGSGNYGLRIFRQVTPPRLETQIRSGGLAVSWKLDDDLGLLFLEGASAPSDLNWQYFGTNNPTLVPTTASAKYFRLRFDQ